MLLFLKKVYDNLMLTLYLILLKANLIYIICYFKIIFLIVH